MKAYDHEVVEKVDWEKGTGTYDVELSFIAKSAYSEYDVTVYGEIEVRCELFEGDHITAPCGEEEVLDVIVSGCEIFREERAIHQSVTPLTEEFLKQQLLTHCS